MADFRGLVRKNRRNAAGGSSSRRGSMTRRDEEEYQEEDMWSFVKESENSGPEMKSYKTLSSSSARRVPSSPRLIQGRRDEPVGVKQSSAPMNIPDWSKIYGKAHLGTKDNDDGFGDGDGDDDEHDRTVPPHEWIARKLARSQISSFSMCEGIGRTLKGRDLSKVRNAVLTRTGFLE